MNTSLSLEPRICVALLNSPIVGLVNGLSRVLCQAIIQTDEHFSSIHVTDTKNDVIETNQFEIAL